MSDFQDANDLLRRTLKTEKKEEPSMTIKKEEPSMSIKKEEPSMAIKKRVIADDPKNIRPNLSRKPQQHKKQKTTLPSTMNNPLLKFNYKSIIDGIRETMKLLKVIESFQYQEMRRFLDQVAFTGGLGRGAEALYLSPSELFEKIPVFDKERLRDILRKDVDSSLDETLVEQSIDTVIEDCLRPETSNIFVLKSNTQGAVDSALTTLKTYNSQFWSQQELTLMGIISSWDHVAITMFADLVGKNIAQQNSRAGGGRAYKDTDARFAAEKNEILQAFFNRFTESHQMLSRHRGPSSSILDGPSYSLY